MTMFLFLFLLFSMFLISLYFSNVTAEPFLLYLEIIFHSNAFLPCSKLGSFILLKLFIFPTGRTGGVFLCWRPKKRIGEKKTTILSVLGYISCNWIILFCYFIISNHIHFCYATFSKGVTTMTLLKTSWLYIGTVYTIQKHKLHS